MLDKGAPLSGNMRLVGEAARAAPKSLQKTDRLPNEHALGSAYEGIAGGGALTAAYALHNPWIAPLGFARPITRGVLRSDTMQGGGKLPPMPPDILRAYLLQLQQQSQRAAQRDALISRTPRAGASEFEQRQGLLGQ
jgi:hypothetical protein